MTIWNKGRLLVAGDVVPGIRTLAYNESSEELDDTAMGDGTRSSAGGLIRWTIEGEAHQAYATLDGIFSTIVGTTVACIWRHTSTSTALAAATPKYSGTGLITSYVPFAGSVGDQHVATFSIVSAGTRTRAIV